MKLELDLTPAEVETLQATLNHYKHVANEESLDYLRDSQAQVFHYNASEVLRAVSTEISRQQGGPSFSIEPQGGETSELRSSYGVWDRPTQQINDIRSAYITYPGLADVLASDSNMYRTPEQREKYADVPDHVWSEQRGVLQIVAADMGFSTALNRKDLSFAQLRQPDGVTPSERYGQQRSISPDRIRKALEARGLGQDSAFVHKASNGIKLAIDQNDDRVEVLRVGENGDASWRYTSHKETPNGFVPGISNQMSGEERDALLEGLQTLEQARELESDSREFLEAFSQGIEQLKQDSPDIAGPGGGAKARIQHNLEVLKRTNDELAGRGEGDLEELFDRADQIMDKEVYRNGDDLTAEDLGEPAITLEDNLPLGSEGEIAVEYYDPASDPSVEPLPSAQERLRDGGASVLLQNANASFFEMAQSAALDHGSMGQGEVIQLDLRDGHRISTLQDSVIISKELNGESTIVYEQDRGTCHLPGNGETFRDQLSLKVKAAITAEVQELDHRALADDFDVDLDSEPDQEMSIFDMLSQPPGPVDMDSMDAVIARDTYGTAVEILTPGPDRDANEAKRLFAETPDIPPLTTEQHAENKAFFDAVYKAACDKGTQDNGLDKLSLSDNLTVIAGFDEMVISRQDEKGNSSLIYEQSRDTAHLSGIGETYSDKLDNGLKSSVLQQVQGLGKSKDDARLAQKFHEVAEVEGHAISGGYRYQGKTVTIESKGPKNLTVTRNLDNSVAFQRQQGQTQQKNLSTKEIKTLDKAYEGLKLDRER